MKLLVSLCVAASVYALLFSGCGGGGSTTGASSPSSPSGSTRAGNVLLTVNWPPPTRQKPAATNSIKVTISQGSSVIASQLLAPASLGSVGSITLSSVAPGSLMLSAAAMPNANGSGVALAQGASGVTVAPGETASVTVTMASTINALTIAPGKVTLGTGQTRSLVASATDSSKNIVPLTPGKLIWSSNNIAAASVDSSGKVTGTGIGPTVVSVTDTETGRSATAAVTSVHPIYGLSFSPFVQAGQDPNSGTVVTSAQVTSLLAGISGYTTWIRTFGMQNGLENVPAIARQMGFKTAIGAYISSDPTITGTQIANLVAAAQAGKVDIAIVGNESLKNGTVTESQLLTYIQLVKAQVPKNVLVTYVDTWNTMLAHPNVVAAVDIVAVNIYPFYDNQSIGQALSSFQSAYANTVAAANGKQVIVTETGWPGSGNPPATGSTALPSAASETAYFNSIQTWARHVNLPLFYFDAYDEAWKANYNDYASWGIWDSNGIMKPGMRAVFQN